MEKEKLKLADESKARELYGTARAWVESTDGYWDSKTFAATVVAEYLANKEGLTLLWGRSRDF